MKNVLIINAHQKYKGKAEGRLTQVFIESARNFFKYNNFNIKETHIDKSYDIEEELEKFAWADYIFFQTPIYWMGLPWKSKKYMDEIFSAGVGTITYKNDGRSRTDPTKKYGSGGLLIGKKYMLSLTYNCPKSEFSNKDSFFEGLSLDEVNYSIHKIFQFCGMEQLKTYAIHDVFKSDLEIDLELDTFKYTLKQNFKLND